MGCDRATCIAGQGCQTDLPGGLNWVTGWKCAKGRELFYSTFLLHEQRSESLFVSLHIQLLILDHSLEVQSDTSPSKQTSNMIKIFNEGSMPGSAHSEPDGNEWEQEHDHHVFKSFIGCSAMNETPEASAHTALRLWRRFLAAPTHRHLQSRSKLLGRFAASLPTSWKMEPKLNDDQFDTFREILHASQRDSKNSSSAKSRHI